MKIFDAIKESNGKFLTVEFIKKDNTVRTINGRLGVKKYLAGGQCKLDQNKFIVIYDLVKKGYRAINKNTILSVRTEGLKIVKKAV